MKKFKFDGMCLKMNKYDKMIEGKKEKSRARIEEVKRIILKMKEEREDVNYYTVSKKANCARSFLYKHSDIKELISNSSNITNGDINKENQLLLRISLLEKQIEELSKEGKDDLRKINEKQRIKIDQLKKEIQQKNEIINKLTIQLFNNQKYE